ncbi:metallophosphatase family protein [Planctomycetota bacterium]|jgi:diadenosine tetraphosphatase ApaH/serine/threonine PP2A family protein phosphatase|nr:metallophosphatase family protein [Planctomycetota bacterium]MDB4426452.1 metallophosphatase family protein [bacterium]MDB4736244.1 metallophosphatase family protein [Planctomycetota bacterium]MDC1043672.1 metallophosphoesterase family protein [bacterium]
MQYAILGDIHANLAALEAVLESLEGEVIDQILQVGDVVGYGAAPGEVIRLLQERDAIVVKGNHDAACVGELDTRLFNANAKAAVDFTLDQLSREDLQWLADLPLLHATDHCVLAHGTLPDPDRFDYIQSTSEADPSLDALDRPVAFVGHTHVPVTIMRLIESPDRTSYTIDREVNLEETTVALVNVGSVGQPRDEDCRAAYALYDTATQRIELRRVEYDIEREADRIVRAGLPKMLADRLFLGI